MIRPLCSSQLRINCLAVILVNIAILPHWIPDKVINCGVWLINTRALVHWDQLLRFTGLHFWPRVCCSLRILQGDVEAVKELLDQGVDPNLKDNAGWTPLVRLIHKVIHLKALFVVQKKLWQKVWSTKHSCGLSDLDAKLVFIYCSFSNIYILPFNVYCIVISTNSICSYEYAWKLSLPL